MYTQIRVQMSKKRKSNIGEKRPDVLPITAAKTIQNQTYTLIIFFFFIFFFFFKNDLCKISK